MDPYRKELCFVVDRDSVQLAPQPLSLYWAILLALSGRLHQRRHWAIASCYGSENLSLEDLVGSAIAGLPKVNG